MSQIAALARISLTRLAAADRLTKGAGMGGRIPVAARLKDFASVRL